MVGGGTVYVRNLVDLSSYPTCTVSEFDLSIAFVVAYDVTILGDLS